MKNQKAFTLAELLGVLVIIAVLGILAIPVIDRTVKENKEEAYQMQLENMKTGLKNWAIANAKSLPDTHGESITVTLAQLKQGTFVAIDIKNPKTGKLFPNDLLLTISNYNGTYIYEVREGSGTEGNTDYNPNAPIIILKGNALEYVDLNASYQEKGVEATTSLGQPITDITTTIQQKIGITTKPVANIVTTVPSEYAITYEVSSNGITTKAYRTVIVKDITPPRLDIPGNISILATQVNGLKLLEGVTVTDNSGETIVPTVSGYVSDIPGKYTLIYTAVDSSGNSVSKIRVITVQDTNAFQQLTGNTVVSGSGLYRTGDGIYRYRGDSDSVKNYINIDGNIYRIIAIDEQGIKVISASPLNTNMAFDNTLRNNANNTYCQVASGTYTGCNIYAAVTGSITNGSKTGTVTQNSSLYNYLNTTGTDAAVTALRTYALPKIVWNIGLVEPANNKNVNQVQKEEEALQATFLVGLMNASDYIQASLDTSCQETGINYSTSCKNNNWLYISSEQFPWTLNGYKGNSNSMWGIDSTNGNLKTNPASDSHSVRPVIYLPFSMKIVGGEGTSANPYQMEMPEV